MNQSTQPERTGGKKRRKPLAMPPPIPDTLENVAKAVLTTPPRKRNEWKFIQEQEGMADGGTHEQ